MPVVLHQGTDGRPQDHLRHPAPCVGVTTVRTSTHLCTLPHPMVPVFPLPRPQVEARSDAMAVETPLTWSVVIPVKVLAVAKSRLAGLADADRRALALAMAVDTVAAAVACRLVGAVVVVTDDDDVTGEARSLGAQVIADNPGSGLNQALIAGAEH